MQKPSLTLLIVVVFWVFLGCRLFQLAPAAPAPQASPTLLPVSPITVDLTLTPTEEATAIPTFTPTPSVTPRTIPAGRVLILVLGSDRRSQGGYRTDVVMLLTVDTHKRTVSTVSFPRDLYVKIPGQQPNRINTVMPRGGFDLLVRTFEVNFGIHPDYYVLVEMQAFTEIIARLDGITVEVGKPLRDRCDRSLDLSKEGWCEVKPGTMEMDGPTALWYVRSRYSTSDFDRLRRAQEVLLAIFLKMMRLNAVAHWPQFYNAYREYVQTNLTIPDLLPLLPTAVLVYRDPSRIHQYILTRAEVTPVRTENGSSVLLPKYEKITEIIDQAVLAP